MNKLISMGSRQSSIEKGAGNESSSTEANVETIKETFETLIGKVHQKYRSSHTD